MDWKLNHFQSFRCLSWYCRLIQEDAIKAPSNKIMIRLHLPVHYWLAAELLVLSWHTGTTYSSPYYSKMHNINMSNLLDKLRYHITLFSHWNKLHMCRAYCICIRTLYQLTISNRYSTNVHCIAFSVLITVCVLICYCTWQSMILLFITEINILNTCICMVLGASSNEHVGSCHIKWHKQQLLLAQGLLLLMSWNVPWANMFIWCH